MKGKSGRKSKREGVLGRERELDGREGGREGGRVRKME